MFENLFKSGLEKAKGKLKEELSDLSEEEIDQLINGDTEQVLVKLQQKYGFSYEEAREKVMKIVSKVKTKKSA